MRLITKKKLEEILEQHKTWLHGEGGERANLYGANLRGANLRGADLREADLREANLYGADLYGANLRGANLRGADLRGADLREANLYEANLYGAYLYGADLRGAKNMTLPIACPEEGEFIGFKKVRDDYIVKLKITADAKRSSATSRKCRCSKAEVISITKIDGTDDGTKDVASKHDSKFIYRVGETVEVDDFCDDRFIECAPGIHFFITREEAVRY